VRLLRELFFAAASFLAECHPKGPILRLLRGCRSIISRMRKWRHMSDVIDIKSRRPEPSFADAHRSVFDHIAAVKIPLPRVKVLAGFIVAKPSKQLPQVT
jgi:hypothetical protein